jgi:hypothetical protein
VSGRARETLSESSNDGWWISFGLRWALLFYVYAFITMGSPTPAGQAIAAFFQWSQRVTAPYGDAVYVAMAWFGAHVFGLRIQGGQFSARPWLAFWNIAVEALGAIPFALIWTIFDRRNRINEVLREAGYVAVRYTLAAAMLNYGAAKVIDYQGIPQPAPLEWIRPLGEISTGQLMWTWLGYSPTFHFFAGVNETVGGILLLFRRTTLLGSLLLLPVMVYVTAMDVAFHVGPQAGAALFAVSALYLVARDGQRLADVFVFGRPTSPRVAVVGNRIGRGLWVAAVAVIFWNYALPHVRTAAAIGGRQSPLVGAYRVERFVSDGRVLPAEAADAARWREVAINWFGDYIRVRRMDDAELLWSAEPGGPYRLAVGYNYYGRLLAKTSGTRFQVRFRELPNYRSPHAAPAAKPGSDSFYTLNFVRNGSDHVSVQGRIDGAEISADLLRISNSNFELFKSREGLP